jgi:hypothetical protein
MAGWPTSVDAWETVTVALLSSFVGGAGGALLATLLRIRHERHEGLRQRMVEAADDFATGVVQARMAFRALHFDTEDDTSEHSAALQEAQRRVEVVEARAGRVLLLFGEFTATGDAAEDAMVGLWTAVDAFRSRDDAVRRAIGQRNPELEFEEAFEQVGEAVREFNRAALRALRRPRFAQSRRRWMRTRARLRREALAEHAMQQRSGEGKPDSPGQSTTNG